MFSKKSIFIDALPIRTGGAHWVEWGQVDRTKDHIRMIAQTIKDWIDRGYFRRQVFILV